MYVYVYQAWIHRCAFVRRNLKKSNSIVENEEAHFLASTRLCISRREIQTFSVGTSTGSLQVWNDLREYLPYGIFIRQKRHNQTWVFGKQSARVTFERATELALRDRRWTAGRDAKCGHLAFGPDTRVSPSRGSRSSRLNRVLAIFEILNPIRSRLLFEQRLWPRRTRQRVRDPPDR